MPEQTDFLRLCGAANTIMKRALFYMMQHDTEYKPYALRLSSWDGPKELAELAPTISDKTLVELINQFCEPCLEVSSQQGFREVESDVAVDAYRELLAALWERQESGSFKDMPEDEVPLPTTIMAENLKRILANFAEELSPKSNS